MDRENWRQARLARPADHIGPGNARKPGGARLPQRLETVRHLETDAILPPDSAICKAAEALCIEASEPYLVNHCLRAYFWARLVNGKQPVDDEALYVALLLHDLGLTQRYRLRPGEGECFTIPGARAAENLARSHHWDGKRARLTAAAITLHLNVAVGAPHSREAQLVRFGSGADVAGLGLKAIPRDQRKEVAARYPRLGMKVSITRDLEAEACAHPSCRIAFLMRRGNFARLIEAAPFAE